MYHNLLVTGGAGFIGSNFVRYALTRDPGTHIVNLDLLTYAGSLHNLLDLPDEARHTFVQGDITDAGLVERLIRKHRIDAIVNFAAESHVDRSITGPQAFIQTNIVGTFTLLETARIVWDGEGFDYPNCRFIQISTDEVYGSLTSDDGPFVETNRYMPNSPYAASKASADMLVRSYYKTYGLPVIVTNCSNNYGPYQYPEKLIPLMILNAITGKDLPVYGDGFQVRDWLHVEDHCAAIIEVLKAGRPGETYNVGGLNEKPNIEIVRTICSILDEIHPRPDGKSHQEQITHVTDRPGHDRRYAINCTKIQRDLAWSPRQSFDKGLRSTIQWYLANQDWVNEVMSENYREWIDLNYSTREMLQE